MSPAGDGAIRVHRVELRSFRSWEDLELVLPPGTALLHGPNGAGKTNILEAVAMLATGSTPRTSRQTAILRDGADVGWVRGEVGAGGAHQQRHVGVSNSGHRRLLVDNEAAPTARAYAEQVPTVVFLPERLLSVRGAPARRRALVDRLTASMDPTAADRQRAYVETLTQRNSLLRRHKGAHSLDGAAARELASWTSSLVEQGTAVRKLRLDALSKISAPLRSTHGRLTGEEHIAVEVELRGDDLAQALDDLGKSELRRGTTLAGPHLDDINFVRAGRDLRREGSTGEQRAALLSWVLAEAIVVRAARAIAPLMLLDDPLAELDPDRQARLLGYLVDWPGQVLVTAPAPPRRIPRGVWLAEVDAGTVGTWSEQT